MLEQLIEEIRRGGTLEIGVLAKKLGIPPQMVEVLLEHLQRTGHVSPYQGCSGACQACGEHASCKAEHGRGTPRLWQG